MLRLELDELYGKMGGWELLTASFHHPTAEEARQANRDHQLDCHCPSQAINELAKNHRASQ
jgi:hypothetical protein